MFTSASGTQCPGPGRSSAGRVGRRSGRRAGRGARPVRPAQDADLVTRRGDLLRLLLRRRLPLRLPLSYWFFDRARSRRSTSHGQLPDGADVEPEARGLRRVAHRTNLHRYSRTRFVLSSMVDLLRCQGTSYVTPTGRRLATTAPDAGSPRRRTDPHRRVVPLPGLGLDVVDRRQSIMIDTPGAIDDITGERPGSPMRSTGRHRGRCARRHRTIRSIRWTSSSVHRRRDPELGVHAVDGTAPSRGLWESTRSSTSADLHADQLTLRVRARHRPHPDALPDATSADRDVGQVDVVPATTMHRRPYSTALDSVSYPWFDLETGRRSRGSGARVTAVLADHPQLPGAVVLGARWWSPGSIVTVIWSGGPNSSKSATSTKTCRARAGLSAMSSSGYRYCWQATNVWTVVPSGWSTVLSRSGACALDERQDGPCADELSHAGTSSGRCR